MKIANVLRFPPLYTRDKISHMQTIWHTINRLLIHYAFLTYRLSSHNGKPPVWHAAKFYFSRERLDYLVVGSVADTTWCDIHKITPDDFMKKCVYEECVYEKVFVKKCVLCH